MVVQWLKLQVPNVGGPGLIPGLGRYAAEGNHNLLHMLAWRIPWTEEPGGLQSIGQQTHRHD